MFHLPRLCASAPPIEPILFPSPIPSFEHTRQEDTRKKDAPDCAWAITSRPMSTGLTARCWMADGFSKLWLDDSGWMVVVVV